MKPLHEVVAEMDPSIEVRNPNYPKDGCDKWADLGIGKQLAAVLKAADALVDELAWLECEPEATHMRNYDAAVADLRRVLEGK